MSPRRPPCKVCHLEAADPVRGTYDTCEGCHKAARDHESPLNLGDGRWVLQGATRVWVPDPTPITYAPRTPRPSRKATAA